MKIAVFCPNWVGDLVMATPAIRGLRRQFPAAEMVAILKPHLSSVIDGTGLVDREIWHGPQGNGTKPAGGLTGWKFGRALRQEKFDLAVLFPNSFRSAWWSWISGAKTRVGFTGNGRDLLLNVRVPRADRKVPSPVMLQYLRLAEAAGCQQLDRQMELAVTPADRQLLAKFWTHHASIATADLRPVCLNPGGAFGAAKHWPTEYFAQLAQRVVDELGRTVLVLSGPAERDVALEIVRQASRDQVVTLATGSVSIGLTKAAVESAELLVTTDSGPRHFAAPLGVPAISIYGPTHPAWSETFDPQSVTLQLPVECGPCQQRTCPLGHHKCLRELTPDRVFRSVVHALEAKKPRFVEQQRAA